MHSYQMTESGVWSCRPDAKENEYFCQSISHKNLESEQLKKVDFAILGFASDLGVERNHGRVGAKLSPIKIRQFLSRMTVPFALSGYDCGDVVVDNNQSLLAAQTQFAGKINQLVEHGITPLVLGGGHETAYGHFMGLLNSSKADDVAILNFDAHFDLRPVAADNEGTSGTPFRQIYNDCTAQGRAFNYYCVGIQPRANIRELYEFAAKSGTKFLEASQVTVNPECVTELISEILAKHKQVYVTICLDVFHYSYAPGVSAPQVLGITPQIVMSALQQLRQSGKVLSLDVVELNPEFDIDNHTARLAAVLLTEFLYS
jgi:formiminoglutamase